MNSLFVIITFFALKLFKFLGLWALIESRFFYRDENIACRLVIRGQTILKMSLWWEWLIYLLILWFVSILKIKLILIVLGSLFFVRLVLVLMRVKGELPIERLMPNKNIKHVWIVGLILFYDLLEIVTIWGIYNYINKL